MAYTNLPPNLQDIFNSVTDRVTKLETGPNSAATDASAAQTTANSAQTTANTALANAATAYTTAQNSLQPSAYAIQNPTTKQLSSIDATGLTVYVNSPTAGARVVLNSAGLAGYNSSGSATFSISASTGAAVFSGSITGSAITGSTLNISGNCIIDSSGFLTATGATITGTINASAGTIGGFTISSTNISSTNLNIASSGTISGGNSSTIYYGYANIGGGTSSGQRLYVTGNSAFIGTGIFNSDLTTQGNFYVPFHPTTTSTANAYLNSSTGLLARSTSSARYKVEIQEQTIPLNSILSLTPKSYVDKGQADEKGTTDGLQRLLGLIAEDVIQIPVIGSMLANLNEKGEPDSVNYDRVAVALIPLLKEHEARLNKLEGK